MLSSMYHPKKTVFARVTYADIAGLDGSTAKKGIGGALLAQDVSAKRANSAPGSSQVRDIPDSQGSGRVSIPCGPGLPACDQPDRN